MGAMLTKEVDGRVQGKRPDSCGHPHSRPGMQFRRGAADSGLKRPTSTGSAGLLSTKNCHRASGLSKCAAQAANQMLSHLRPCSGIFGPTGQHWLPARWQETGLRAMACFSTQLSGGTHQTNGMNGAPIIISAADVGRHPRWNADTTKTTAA